jgi:hypothetical protein
MIIRVTETQARAILGSMRDIALAHGASSVSDADSATIEAAARIVLGLPDGVPAGLAPCPPDALARAMAGDQDDGNQAVRMLAVMSLAGGRIDQEKIALVQQYADALSVHESYVVVLAEAAAGEIAAASACMIRKNAESFPRLDLQGIDADPIAPFLPYRGGRDDAGLAARYEALADLGASTFGRAFWEHFKRNGFAFPGDPNGLAEGFTTPHDTSHVLSGYSTSAQGELLVSTFIGAMHPDHPMSAEVLPVLFSWHLGIALNKIAGSWRGAFEPRKFWTAWDRGAATSVDVLDPGWDFWTAVHWPLDELRREHGVSPADPALLA